MVKPNRRFYRSREGFFWVSRPLLPKLTFRMHRRPAPDMLGRTLGYEQHMK